MEVGKYVLAVAALVAIVCWIAYRRTRARSAAPSRFFALPCTRPGRASAILFLLAIVLLMLASTVLADVGPTVGMINVGPAIGGVVMLAGLGTGAVALVKGGERSWVVWLSTLIPALVLGAEVLSMVIPGE